MLSFNQGSILPRPSVILFIVFFLFVLLSRVSFAQDAAVRRIKLDDFLVIRVEHAVLVAWSAL